jgi:hypothetical protein
LKYSAKRSRCSSGVHAVFSPFFTKTPNSPRWI